MFRSIQALVRVATVFLAAPVFAGWNAGDIVCVTAASGVGPGIKPAVLRIQPSPLSVSSVLADNAIQGHGAFDSYRNRVVVLRSAPLGFAISLLDSNGSFSDMLYPGNQDAQLVAPAGDGRIYFQRPGKISYFDAGGSVHDLLNSTGAGVFALPRQWSRMYFDAATHSLFMGSNSGINALITKIPLTADGTRVAGAPIDTIFVTAQLVSPIVVGFSPGPNGTVFVKLDDNSGNTAPRLLLMNPATIDISVFASSGYFGVGGEIAGCFSPVLNAALVIDSLSDNLRIFTLGSTGAGTVSSQQLISSAGGSGELAEMFPITATTSACPGDINNDGFVDDADFIFFVQGYNILDCADPSMPPGCPADFNHDGFVDDADFLIFVVGYNELVCP